MNVAQLQIYLLKSIQEIAGRAFKPCEMYLIGQALAYSIPQIDSVL
ncbi:hypothetical protein HNQ88_001221 [Aureibacter tunicatorum]|uniref:Uncharacterized protein n=1 Tax=Aureibacter tunicatorum TaxID=866807 RepID=A0AAE3XLP8_9BACT|nr:hypothetical protein [Aureibacter tunicatorum]BDD03278.1 hypothetical protein AUTU_07610 [Aureibacter tunicatorum]